jgi:hypothetical protein
MPAHTPDFESEDQMQEWLEGEFESAGWTAVREVSPHNSNLRADLLVHHEDYDWIGIECKYMSSPRNGKKIAEAVEQIVTKYRGRKYIGKKIDLWAFCPYYYKDNGSGNPRQTIGGFLTYFGIGYLPLDRSQLKIGFAMASKDTKILVKNLNDRVPGKTYEYGDIDAIRSTVKSRLGVLD